MESVQSDGNRNEIYRKTTYIGFVENGDGERTPTSYSQSMAETESQLVGLPALPGVSIDPVDREPMQRIIDSFN